MSADDTNDRTSGTQNADGGKASLSAGGFGLYECLCHPGQLASALTIVGGRLADMGIDARRIKAIVRAVGQRQLVELAGSLKSKTYVPQYNGLVQPGDFDDRPECVSYVRHQIVQAAVTKVLLEALCRDKPNAGGARTAADRVARMIQSGLTRAWVDHIEQSTTGISDEGVLRAAAAEIHDREILGLLGRVLAVVPPGQGRALLEPSLFEIACLAVDRVLANAREIGRRGSFFAVESLRFMRTIVVLVRPDRQFEWVLPACQRRVAEELFVAGLIGIPGAAQDVDLNREPSLRVFGFLLQSHRSGRDGRRVEICEDRAALREQSLASAQTVPLTEALLPSGVPLGKQPSAPSWPRKWQTMWSRNVVGCCIATLLALGTVSVISMMTRTNNGWDPYSLFSFDSFSGDVGEMPYALYIPPAYRSADRYPLVVFLHSAREAGEDGRRPLRVGLGPLLVARARSRTPIDALVFIPQSLTGHWDPGEEDGVLLMQTLDRVQERYAVDPDRIYLTGIADGGRGVWQIAARYPDKWAAIVPVGGRAIPATAAKIKHIPCWFFAGGADTTVEPGIAHEMISALRRAGGNPSYTKYDGRARDYWIRAYSTPELWPWLLGQHLLASPK